MTTTLHACIYVRTHLDIKIHNNIHSVYVCMYNDNVIVQVDILHSAHLYIHTCYVLAVDCHNIFTNDIANYIILLKVISLVYTYSL